MGWSFYVPLTRPGPWSIPARIWKVLSRRRMILPTPILYILVSAVGLVLGIVLQLTAGLWWWVWPIALLVIAWLITVTSIWWRPQIHLTSVRAELLEVVNPEKGAAARRREEQERIRTSGLPLFEVEQWLGPAYLGGWSGSGAGISYVSLAFAEQPESAPVVTVGTVVKIDTVANDGSDDARVRAQLVGELTDFLIQEPSTTPESPLDLHNRIKQRLHSLPWTHSTMQLDDREYQGFRMLVDGSSASYFALERVWVTVTAKHDTGIRLETVKSPERYLDAL